MPTLTLLARGAIPDAHWFETVGLGAPGAIAQWREAMPPRLTRQLARARFGERWADPDPVPLSLPEERWLAGRFGLQPPDTFAAYALRARDPQAAGWCVRPVHLHVGRDHVILGDAAPALDDAEADALFEAAREEFVHEGLSLLRHGPALWSFPQWPHGPLEASSADCAAGRNLERHLPRGEGARPWRRVANAVQMAWHAHPVNAAREAASRPAINGLWLEGRADAEPESPYTHVCGADGAFADALAGLAGALRADRPVARGAPTPVLECIEGFRAARIAGDWTAWLDAWHEFDRLLAPLDGAAIELVLTGERTRWHATLAPHPRWWRWPARREDFVGRLARAEAPAT